ncbi:MAG: hypothetical protein V1836_03150 [Candidatus Aenigmatarchaeota archaeon]
MFYDNMFNYNVAGVRWGFTFLRGASYLSEADKFGLMTHATEMYLRQEDERPVKSNHYTGRITTQRKYEILGTFGGIHFDAELETERGKDRMSFLVSEQTKGRRFDFSAN